MFNTTDNGTHEYEISSWGGVTVTGAYISVSGDTYTYADISNNYVAGSLADIEAAINADYPVSSFNLPSEVNFDINVAYTIDFSQYAIGNIQNIRWTHYYVDANGDNKAISGQGNFTGNHGLASDKQLQVYYAIDGVEMIHTILLRSN